MKIDEIENGYVLDHISAGNGMRVYEALGLDKLSCQVAIIQNAKSDKLGVKDIIKVNELIDLNLDVLGFIDSNITVNVIKNGVAEKKSLTLPEKIVNIAKCSNPRCISNVEENVDYVFELTDKKGTYRCIYCETKAK
ncbi:MAG: aspartate carbamoyltransferase regulatory subunit [Clostridiales bacterium]|nr:aspartate carbamoyltransferase regulatory subunit [Clostridiales bacterium]MCD7872497.1 aspartate carbamoyltransferase regulatory subunit [Clostridiales bacterium]